MKQRRSKNYLNLISQVCDNEAKVVWSAAFSFLFRKAKIYALCKYFFVFFSIYCLFAYMFLCVYICMHGDVDESVH